MKRVRIGLAIMAATSVLVGGRMAYISSDSYLRSMVVKLQSPKGSCSGVKVIAPSGRSYVLTARHCEELVDKGRVLAIEEDDSREYLNLVAVSKYSDLMLLSSPDKTGVVLASDTDKHQSAHSMTHGHGFPSYRTDGELLEKVTIDVKAFEIISKADIEKCLSQEDRYVAQDFIFEVCIAKESVMASTVHVVPGSSGGPVVNEYGSLIGIVSASDDAFSYLVSLGEIKAFLANR